MTSPEARCVVCDEPCRDHLPLRYALRPWIKHRVFFARERLVRKIDCALQRLYWQM